MNLLYRANYLPIMIYNELYLMGIMYWNYKWSYTVNAITTATDFIWWMLLIDGGVLIPAKIAPAVVGYIIWIYASYVIYDAHYFMVDASQTGVLEQVYLSPFPFIIKLLSRFISAITFCSLELVFVLIALLILCPTWIPITPAAFFIFFMTMIGIAGFALVLSGMGLMFKKSQPFAYLINTIILFCNGSILPLDQMPPFVQMASQTLPTTQGIALLRAVIFKHQTLAAALYDGSLIILILNSLCYLLIGALLFGHCEKWAKANGSLGHY